MAGSQARISARDQLDRASTSIALNIAEGNTRFSVADRARFVQTAVGSAVECAACLDVLVARGLLEGTQAEVGKEFLEIIVRMLMGLLDRLGYRFDADESARVRENGVQEFGGGPLVDDSGDDNARRGRRGDGRRIKGMKMMTRMRTM